MNNKLNYPTAAFWIMQGMYFGSRKLQTDTEHKINNTNSNYITTCYKVRNKCLYKNMQVFNVVL